MKYIQYTYVDVKTQKPVSQEPAKRGPAHPQGVTPTFTVEATFQSGTPTFFGIAEDTFTPEDWMREITEEDFYNRMRTEFKDRATKRRKEVEEGGYWYDPQTFLRTDKDSQTRLSQLVTTINNDPDVTTVDFEKTPGNWTVLDTATSLETAKTVSRHVQRCFSWCKGVHGSLDAATTLEQMLPIVQGISDFEVADNPSVDTNEGTDEGGAA